MAENNRVYAYTYIEDIPRVLIVEQEGSGREWESMLSRSGGCPESDGRQRTHCHGAAGSL